jgi:hypothetical protein
MASIQLRQLIDNILADTSRDMREQCDTVDVCFQKRLEEMEDSKTKMEENLRKVLNMHVILGVCIRSSPCINNFQLSVYVRLQWCHLIYVFVDLRWDCTNGEEHWHAEEGYPRQRESNESIPDSPQQPHIQTWRRALSRSCAIQVSYVTLISWKPINSFRILQAEHFFQILHFLKWKF